MVLFLALGLIWGGSHTFITISLGGLTPSQLVLARLLLGAVVLLAIVRMRGVKLPSFGVVWAHIAVAAILGLVAPFLLLAWGQQHTSAGMAGVLIGAMPLITLAFATFTLPSERATVRKTVGLLIGFAGVVLVVAPWGDAPGTLGGQVAVLGAAACYAAQAVYIRKVLSGLDIAPLALAAAQVMAATVLQALVTPLFAWHAPTFTWPVVVSIVLLGTVATGAGYVLYFRLIRDHGATTASAVNYLVPVAAVVIGVLTLSESITWSMAAGTVIVLLGLAIAENRLGVAPTRAQRAGKMTVR
ncbi:DMT family transporter [Kibdelosporangium phytohabitans]|uniref:Transporter n=1 Tax=Kibdelosporangium phytohabitans TaxID=860235 RepID=A0A0N9I352_9PSEU|nr:DMT family transporter [Kibdelosporangium phytohabitans]ALG09185.1 transporter [Kibdelosporangium phytohabitans]MBE1469588.1 drug/metabolite transporter (DMT)-like permease [Kibdelosporangium phytohabitans]